MVRNGEFKEPEEGNLQSIMDQKEALRCETIDGAQAISPTRTHQGGLALSLE